MVAIVGPNSANNGLIFGYDMLNTGKSFQGEPYVNGFIDDGQGTNAPWTPSGGGETFIEPSLTFRGRKVHYVAPTSNSISMGSPYLDTTTAPYNSWTLEVFVKRVDGLPITETARAIVYLTGNLNSVLNHDPVALIAVEDGWYQVIDTATLPTPGNLFLVGLSSFLSNVPLYVADWKVEPATLATSTWKPSGSRSNTEALNDISVNDQTITDVNIAYNVDNTFSFDGAGYWDCGVVPGLDSSLTELTVEAWVKPGFQGLNMIAENGTSFSANTFYLAQENASNFTFEVYGGTGTGYDAVANTSGYTAGNWYHLVGTWAAGEKVELFQNTNFTNADQSSPTIQPTVQDGNTSLQVGTRPGPSLQYTGEIPIFRIYNRRLTFREVFENYHADRRKFGLNNAMYPVFIPGNQPFDVTLNPNDKSDEVVLSNGNLTAGRLVSPALKFYNMARATLGRSSGLWYFEFKHTAGSNTTTGGFSSAGSSINDYVGLRTGAVGIGGSGNVAPGSGGLYSGVSSFGLNGVGRCAINLDSGRAWFASNGNAWLNTLAGTHNPDTLTGGVTWNGWSASDTYYPAVAPRRDSSQEITVYFGLADFTYAPPTGFLAWNDNGPITEDINRS